MVIMVYYFKNILKKLKLSIDLISNVWYNRKVIEMQTKVICKECKETFDINRDNVNFEKPFIDENGQSIFITYFDCPSCKERHYVQVDNIHTLGTKKKVQMMFGKMCVMRNKNKVISKQQQDKFKNLREKLNNCRFELMKQYEDLLVTNTETGEEVKLNFTTV